MAGLDRKLTGKWDLELELRNESGREILLPGFDFPSGPERPADRGGALPAQLVPHAHDLILIHQGPALGYSPNCFDFFLR